MADRTIAKKRHRAVCNVAVGFDLCPPDTTVAQADAILVQWFGNDYVLHAVGVEPAVLGQIGHAAKTP